MTSTTSPELLNNSKNEPDELLKSTQYVVIEVMGFGRL